MSALLAASRPTRRDMARHPLRILAAVLLITLPLFIASWTLTEGHSEHTASLQDQGRTTATWQGGSCVQSVNGSDADCTSPPAGDDPRVPEILRDSLPAGFTAELHVHAWGAVSHGERHATLSLQQHPGKRTPAPGEVWLNTATARDLRVETGDTVTFTPQGTGKPVELTVAGTMPGFTSLVGAPGLMDPDAFHLSEGLYPTWSITGPEEFTWDDVLALNAVGFTVVSRDVIDNPPPPEAVAEQFRGDPLDHGERVTSVDDWSIRLITLAGILTVGLLAMLVISPVFTIATSRMARIFALMSAQGATPWHIRLAVLTYGFVAGLIGATVGVALGVGAAAVQWFLRFPDWPFTVPWGSLLLMWAVAVGGSTAASLLPAWVASRASISAGVQGASPDRLLRWRPWMAVGPVGLALLTVGMLVLWMTTAPGTRYYWSTLPALALVVLLAASAPALVWGLGRLGRNAPLALRIALRDAGRQAMRSVPALAAVMAVLAVAVAIHADQTASQSRDRALFDTVYQGQSLLVSPAPTPGVAPDAATVDEVVAMVQAETGASQRIDLRGTRYLPEDSRHHEIDHDMDDERRQRQDHVSGPLEQTQPSLLEASPEVLSLLRLDDADRDRALTALSVPAILVPVGTPESELRVREMTWDDTRNESVVLAETVLPTVPVLPELSPTALFTPPGLAELGAPSGYVGTVIVPEERLPYGVQERLRRRVADETVGTSLQISPAQWLADWWPAGFAGILGTGVVVVIALVMALSWQGSRRQFALLDAIGAPPSLPSRVSGAFAGLLALVGSAGGVFFGYLAAFMLTSRTRTFESGLVQETGTVGYLVPDWRLLLILLVATPVLAWAVGSLFHRHPGELEYRET